MKYKGIIFDLDGTLVDTSIDLLNAVNYALKRNGFNSITKKEAILNTGDGMLNLIKRSSKCDDENMINKLFNDFKEYYSNHYLDYSNRYDGLIDVVKELKNKGYKLGVVSNKRDEFTKEIISTLYTRLFDYVTGEKEGLKLKPSPDLVDLCLKELNISKEDALFIGDSYTDYLTGINSKVDVLMVTYGFRSKEFLESKGINILIDRPEEILDFIGE